LSQHPHNSAAEWFKATEGLGDDIDILYGRIHRDSQEVEWLRVSHCECDGIGGFARLLRERVNEIGPLPQTNSPCRGILGPIWNLWRNRKRPTDCADRRNWVPEGPLTTGALNTLAWHVFAEEETASLRDTCRRQQVTVNSLLLKHLDASVRPELGMPTASIPWMIPVNLRGDVRYPDDTANHVSSVDLLVSPEDSAFSIHQKILHQLDQGEHRANFLLMELGGCVARRLKMRYLLRDRAQPRGNIGAFSNLGSWDPENRIGSGETWLFCPPVVQGQRLSAGCLTFQNRLSLVMQSRPYASAPPDLISLWMERWVGRILSEAG
jgi:hypothetical protein